VDGNAEGGRSQHVACLVEQQAGYHQKAEESSETPAVETDAEDDAEGYQRPAGLVHAKGNEKSIHESPHVALRIRCATFLVLTAR
jgi:hypothetical protein